MGLDYGLAGFARSEAIIGANFFHWSGVALWTVCAYLVKLRLAALGIFVVTTG